MPSLLTSFALLVTVAFLVVDGSRTVTKFTPGFGCGTTTEIKVVSSKGDKGDEEDQPCTLRTYLDESEISFHNEDPGLFGAQNIASFLLHLLTICQKGTDCFKMDVYYTGRILSGSVPVFAIAEECQRSCQVTIYRHGRINVYLLWHGTSHAVP